MERKGVFMEGHLVLKKHEDLELRKLKIELQKVLDSFANTIELPYGSNLYIDIDFMEVTPIEKAPNHVVKPVCNINVSFDMDY